MILDYVPKFFGYKLDVETPTWQETVTERLSVVHTRPVHKQYHSRRWRKLAWRQRNVHNFVTRHQS
jgi:hypothetical protein